MVTQISLDMIENIIFGFVILVIIYYTSIILNIRIVK